MYPTTIQPTKPQISLMNYRQKNRKTWENSENPVFSHKKHKVPRKKQAPPEPTNPTSPPSQTPVSTSANNFMASASSNKAQSTVGRKAPTPEQMAASFSRSSWYVLDLFSFQKIFKKKKKHVKKKTCYMFLIDLPVFLLLFQRNVWPVPRDLLRVFFLASLRVFV